MEIEIPIDGDGYQTVYQTPTAPNASRPTAIQRAAIKAAETLYPGNRELLDQIRQGNKPKADAEEYARGHAKARLTLTASEAAAIARGGPSPPRDAETFG